ncbi:replicative DNA helicase [Sinosporangium siamense]|uniref:SF4 helicase domain-containing protein n=2 Tax=Sinosporangium siamense TaxID=1367973 RepID=A0A919RPE2_9ACTN|nr:DnaB-like helicase C-terminal domain-containing protein [Sinosporangium siamense]GII95739.1 hypothetical protein Ssi02_59700 [Sinosporangium siamense]
MMHLGSEYLSETLDLIKARAAAPDDSTAMPTGFEDFDALTAGGLRPGSLTVIASRPGMGRSTLMADICRHNALAKGRPVAVWTFEEEAHDFTVRLLSTQARVARHSMLSGALVEDDWTRIAKARGQIEAAPLHLSTPSSLTMAQFADEAAELVATRGVRLIAIDGIHDIRPERRRDLHGRKDGTAVQELKTLARDLKVAVLVTSHLKRAPKQVVDKRPHVDDLRDSDAIAYGADLLVLLHREDGYGQESDRAGEADLIIAKYRHGPCATITVAFQGHYGRFIDIPRNAGQG